MTTKIVSPDVGSTKTYEGYNFYTTTVGSVHRVFVNVKPDSVAEIEKRIGMKLSYSFKEYFGTTVPKDRTPAGIACDIITNAVEIDEEKDYEEFIEEDMDD